MKDQDIFTYVNTEKTNFETGVGVPVASDWYFSMYKHNNYTLLMKNGQFPVTQVKEIGEKPYKNIILPILNVAYRSEGFDVKDIEIYVDDEDFNHLSLLARKFHNKWALENNIDTFIDEIVETADYGYVLVKNVNETRPEVVQPQQIAFCDQTDILTGTICLKHQYSIDQLKEVGDELGWDKEKIDLLVQKSTNEKQVSTTSGQKADIPQKSIEVFEVHGSFPQTWLKKDGDEDYNSELDANEYSKQLHIISFTKDKDDGTKQGVTLYKGLEGKSVFKVMKLNPIFGRAAGRGRVEELFEPQIWVNFNMIHMQNMLAEASKVIQVTTDKKFTQQNKLKNKQSGDVLYLEEGKTLNQLNTQPVNFNLFDRAFQEWEQHARTTGSASDPQLGLNPVSGTPLGTTQIVTAQGLGIHDYNRGKFATFVSEIYRDWVMGYLIKEMNRGDKWLDELDQEELIEVAERVAKTTSNKRIKELVLSGKMVTPEEQAMLLEIIKEQFKKSGNKKFIKIMEGEFKGLLLKVKVNVAGKQKNMQAMADKLSNVFRAIFANPQGFVATMQIPQAAKAFSQMLEQSGMDSFDYASMGSEMGKSIASPMQPQKELAISNNEQ